MKKKLILFFSILLIVGCLFTSCEQESGYCTVKFKGAGDIPDQVVAKGGRATEPKVSATKVPYKFVGWTLDGDSFDCNTDTVTRDLVLVAHWEAQCTVIFDTNGGSEIEPQIVALGAKAEKPQDPTRAGYTFKGWNVEGNPLYDFNTDIVDSTYLVLSANWEEKIITVSYNSNGGTFEKNAQPESRKVKYGTTITIPDVSSSNLKKTGCYLEGWTLDMEGTGTVYHAGDEVQVTPEQNMVLFAKWAEPEVDSIGISRGPSNGYIIYDCDADNDKDADGNVTGPGSDGLMSSVCGWRYIEAAPSPLSGSYCYGYYRYNDITSTNNSIPNTNGSAVGDGKSNTDHICNSLGPTAHLEEKPTTETVVDEAGKSSTQTLNPTGNYAAKACYDFSLQNSDGMTYDDWYLPSIGEFYQLYLTYTATQGLLPSARYITSTEASETQNWVAVAVSNGIGTLPQYNKYQANKAATGTVFPVRYF